MGAEESHINLDQVPGFNPGLSPLKRGQEARGQQPNRRARDIGLSKQGNAEELQNNQDDAFFRYVDVGDSIRPIYDEVETRKREELDETIEGVVDLSKLLDELNVQKRVVESDSEGDLIAFPDISDSDDNSDSGSDDDDRGKYHHDVEEQADDTIDVYSPDAHLLAVKGDCCVAEVLKCRDLSEWRNQFPLHQIQWFLSSEIGSQVSFKASPACEGPSFEVPAEAIGRYIQVVGTRRVENQLRETYQDAVEGGVYDPHVQKAGHTDQRAERTYTDVHSTSVVGPVLISDGWSYTIMSALRDGEFQCAVKLRDEILESKEHGNIKGQNLSKVPAAMTINMSTVEFHYVVTNANKKSIGTSSLFSLEWLAKLFRHKGDPEELETKAKKLSGDVTAQMRLRTVAFRLSSTKKTIILATRPRKKGYSHTKVTQDLIRFDPDPDVGRDVLFYVCLGFQAAIKFKLDDQQFWVDALEKGEVDHGKDLVQRYIEYATTTVEEEAPAYEEMPLNPWDY